MIDDDRSMERNDHEPSLVGVPLQLPAPPEGCRWGLVDFGKDGGWQIVAVAGGAP